MPQTRETGAAANEYGHATARAIAAKIGAVPVTEHSNEFAFQGKLVTIRCASQGDNQVGVLYTMLKRIDLVIAAFEEEHAQYRLFSMTPHLYATQLRDSKHAGKVGLVRKTQFKDHGTPLQIVSLN